MDASPYIAGNYAPVTTEQTLTDLKVVGQIPTELEGRLLRNGPNPLDVADISTHHWFLGDGMVHGVRLSEGKAQWYRNRYVGSTRTQQFLGPRGIGPLLGGIGPNTNVIGHAGKTYALVEGGIKPVEMTYELSTVRTNGFEDSLQNGYTAHPKYDPLTGEMHAICYSYLELGPTVQYVVIGADGKMTKTLPISVPSMPMIHDMALTQNYVVVMDLPVAVDLDLAFGGSQFPVRWFDDYNPVVGLLPRSAESEVEIIWCSIDPCFAFHPMNAYDTEDGKVVIDICEYEKIFDADRNGPFRDSLPILARWTCDPVTRSVKREVIDDRSHEFPRVAGSALNQPYRFGYTASVVDESSLNNGPTYKHDLVSGTTIGFDHGAGRESGEPVFVSRQGATSEDDGWIMTMVYDAAKDSSDLVIIDALNFNEEVARVELGVRVPNGFHGNWVRDTVTPPNN